MSSRFVSVVSAEVRIILPPGNCTSSEFAVQKLFMLYNTHKQKKKIHWCSSRSFPAPLTLHRPVSLAQYQPHDTDFPAKCLLLGYNRVITIVPGTVTVQKKTTCAESDSNHTFGNEDVHQAYCTTRQSDPTQKDFRGSKKTHTKNLPLPPGKNLNLSDQVRVMMWMRSA